MAEISTDRLGRRDIQQLGTAVELVLILGIGILMTTASSQWVDKKLSKLIQRLLSRYTELDIKDYAAILHLAGEYSIHELYVEAKDWLAN